MQILSAESLVTSRAETRKGFIDFALEKNRRAQSYIDEAKALRYFASKAASPDDLLVIPEIRSALLTASGLSDKAIAYFDESAKTKAINEMIEEFLKPVGDEFIDEVVFRFLLIKGDSLGGSMRNVIGSLAQKKLVRNFLSVLNLFDIEYFWLSNKGKVWRNRPSDDFGIEGDIKAISWNCGKGNRTLDFNMKIRAVDKNVDICLFSCSHDSYANGKIIEETSRHLMFGELKGGIDPAGADEHWKTANTALERIRNAYSRKERYIMTSFVGAAIEKSMAEEIFSQLSSHRLNMAANLTKDNQMYEYCNWILSL
ncbi:MAG: hypothetical protein NC112_00630 [Oxalobacter formigenes]|nr:hypothetical protein [Oxalobacter formigenes]